MERLRHEEQQIVVFCGTRPVDVGAHRPSRTVGAYQLGFSPQEWWELQRSLQPSQQINQNTGGEMVSTTGQPLFTDIGDVRLEIVANPFKMGLGILNLTIRKLATAKSEDIAKLKLRIEAITSCFRKAVDEANVINERLRKRKTSLVIKRSDIEENLRCIEQKKQTLEAKLKAYKDELPQLMDELQLAQKSYETSQETLKKAEKALEQKKLEQNAVRVAGVASVAAVVVAPIAAPVIGITLLALSETALEKSVESARENVQLVEKHLQDKRKCIKEKKDSIAKKKNKIESINRDKYKLQMEKNENDEEYTKCEKNFGKLSVLCDHLQVCHRFISITAGHSEVLRDQMTFFYDIQPLFSPLKSLADHLTPNFLEYPAFKDFHQNLEAITLQATAREKICAVELSSNATATMGKEEVLQHLRCEQYLLPVPMALALFGQVCTLSLKRDFSIETPREGFRFLKWPESFRANLQDISHTISSAFETAHVNMCKIHEISKVLPVHLHLSLRMLNNIDQDFEIRFRNCMESIGKNSETCLSLSKDIENAFVKIIETLMELQESCTSSKSTKEKELKEKKIQRKENEEMIKEIKSQQKFHLDRLSQLKAETLKAEKQYQDSLELPGFLETSGVGITQLASGIKGMLNNLSKPVTKLKVKYNKWRKDKNLSQEEKRSYKIASKLKDCIEKLEESYIENGTLNLKALHECEEMTKIKTRVQNKEKRLLDTTGNCVKERLLGICKDIKDLCQYLQTFKEIMNANDQEAEHKTKAREIESIKDRLEDIIEEGDRRVVENRHEDVTPVKSLFVEEAKKEDSLSSTIRKYKMKSEARLHQAERSQKRYDDAASDLMESNEELVDALVELASLKIENIDYEATIDLFNKSIKTLAGIREQWSQLVQYFQSVVAIIDCSLDVSLRNIESHSKGNACRTTMTKLKIEIISNQVGQAMCLASGLNHIAETYTQVSSELFLPVTQHLQCLLGWGKSDSMIELEIKSFEEKCTAVQKRIGTIIQENQSSFLHSEERISYISQTSDESNRDEVDDFI